MKIEGFLRDIGGAGRVTKLREELIASGSPVPQPDDPIRDLADKLHPGKQTFIVERITDASPTSKTFRFVPENGHVPVFQCGQYANFYLRIGSSTVTRAYSISSAPYEARGEENPERGNLNGAGQSQKAGTAGADVGTGAAADRNDGETGFFEVTIRRNRPYFVPDYFFEQVKVGDKITAALPFGQFYYEPLRDTTQIVALAGGSGITPFVSMAKEIAHGTLPVQLTILYGSVKHTDIVCGEQLAAAQEALAEYKKAHPEYAGALRQVHVMSDDPAWDGEKGFINTELIRKYSDGIGEAAGVDDRGAGEPEGTADGAGKGRGTAAVPEGTAGKASKTAGAAGVTYFFCGPLPMYNLVRASLKELGVPARRFRHDVMAQPADVTKIPGYPAEQKDKQYKITVVRGIQEDVIPASASEPVAVALERAAIPIDTHCRGGECGFCRSQLLSGDIFVSPLGDGRRREDKKMGWFHACSAYPVSDLKIKIPIL